MTVRISVDVNGLTWEDLIAFVDAARSSVSSGELVEWETDEQEEPTALVADVDPYRLGSPPVVLSHEAVRGYVDVLDAIQEAEGDARQALGRLSEMKSELLGPVQN